MIQLRKRVVGTRVTGVTCLLAVVTVCGVAYADAQSKSDGASDAAVQKNVQAALNADKTLLAKHVTVSVENGVVVLKGFVLQAADVEKAKRDAAAVAGVKKVKNEMTLKPGEGESGGSG